MPEEKTTPETPDQDAIAKQEAEAAAIKANVDAQLEKQKDVFRNRFKFLREFIAKCNGLDDSLRPKSLNEKMSYESRAASDRLIESRMWATRLHGIVLMRCHFTDVVKAEESIPLDKNESINLVIATEEDVLNKVNEEINNLISQIQSEHPITNDNLEAWGGTYIVERLMEAQMWLQEA